MKHHSGNDEENPDGQICIVVIELVLVHDLFLVKFRYIEFERKFTEPVGNRFYHHVAAIGGSHPNDISIGVSAHDYQANHHNDGVSCPVEPSRLKVN